MYVGHVSSKRHSEISENLFRYCKRHINHNDAFQVINTPSSAFLILFELLNIVDFSTLFLYDLYK